nr:helix-turn-helix domain-containing protein [Ornithinimicrobium sp. HY1745]
MLAANEPSQAVQVAVEHVATELGCPVSWVGVIKGDRLVMAGHVGLTSTEMVTAWNLRVGDGIGGRVAEHRRPHMSRDYRHDSRRVPLMKRLIDNEGIQATLTVPLLSADEALGVLYAAHHRPYPWSDHELTMLEQIAQDLATRLRQLDVDGRTGRRRDAAERERRRAVESHQRFGAFATSLGAQDDPEGILDLLAREVRVDVTLTRDGHRVFHSPALGEPDDQPTVAEFDLEDTDGLTLTLQRGQDLDELDCASATLGAALFRLQWLRLAERERTVERLSASLMDQLLTGRVTDLHDVHRRASLLGLRLTPGRVWVVGSRTDPVRLDAFEGRLREVLGACLTSRQGSRLVVVMDVPDSEEPSPITILRDLLRAERGDLVAGVGRLCSTVGDYAMSYDQARAACELGLRSSSTDVVHSTKDFGSLALASLPLPHLKAVAQDVLGAVLEADRERENSDLLDTLRAYLDSDRHLPTTAATLHVHYNTVRKRVTRLEELLGLEFGSVEDRYRVETALRMHALTRVLDGTDPTTPRTE